MADIRSMSILVDNENISKIGQLAGKKRICDCWNYCSQHQGFLALWIFEILASIDVSLVIGAEMTKLLVLEYLLIPCT